MFTGLIQDMGSVREFKREAGLTRLIIHTALPTEEFQQGESVAVDGACLTVVRIHPGGFEVEVSPETLARSTLGERRPGHRVNLERALRLSDRLGGHLVTGHIDGVGWIHRRHKGAQHLDLEVRIPLELGRYLVEKGSVALDGVSLTVNRWGSGWLALTLIPHTIEKTTLAEKAVGDRVNVECDMIGKYVEKFLQGRAPAEGPGADRLTEEHLRRHGFL